jgi:S-(hydroxymethyl)glutathione dehydrogenase / alcohol dehydrogenase
VKIEAVVFREPKAPVKIETLELDDPHDHEVLVKIEACGFCHSDYGFWVGHNTGNFPAIHGHEACGVVEKIGPGVTRVKKGDRIVGCWMAPCGTCYQCLRGRPNICEGTAEFFGKRTLLDGTSRITDKNGKMVGQGFVSGFATHSVMPEICAIPVGPNIKSLPEHLCQLGCSILTGWGAVTNAANLQENDTVAIWGCGGVGLNAIRAAAVRRCRLVIAVDLEASKRDIAMTMGATHFIDSTKNDPIPIIKQLTDGRGVECAMEAIGDPGAQVQAWWSLRSGATFITIGITPEHSTTNLNWSFLPPHKIRIQGVLYGDTHPLQDIPNMARLMDEGVLMTDKLVSKTIRLQDLNEARKAMEERRIIGRWVVKM